MGKSPTDKSTLKNGAAKKDFVGDDGDFTFSINDLLANDPGGANKNGNFFFGDFFGGTGRGRNRRSGPVPALWPVRRCRAFGRRRPFKGLLSLVVLAYHGRFWIN